MRRICLIFALLFPSAFVTCRQTPPKPVSHNIQIKVAIIYTVGGPQPVAREDFYLLDKDAAEIWKEAGMEQRAVGLCLRFLPIVKPLGRVDSLKCHEALKAHMKATVTTDFNGEATFLNVLEGTYYIYGMGTLRTDKVAVWNHKASTNDKGPVFLDNNNAYYFPSE